MCKGTCNPTLLVGAKVTEAELLVVVAEEISDVLAAITDAKASN